ncbi:hypothetical protein C8J56DRAFT_1037789 [Mycena floridula]|nr:hypothetical protein C8J56DRAFT_1037789 [Mycena floridula]
MLEDPAGETIVDIPSSTICLNLFLQDTELEHLDRILSALRFNDSIIGNVDAINNLAILALSRLPLSTQRTCLSQDFSGSEICSSGHQDASEGVGGGQPDAAAGSFASRGHGSWIWVAAELDLEHGWIPFHSSSFTCWADAGIRRFQLVDPEAQGMLLSLFRDIIPQYLVYHSVLKAINDPGQFKVLMQSPHQNLVDGSIARDVWRSFQLLGDSVVQLDRPNRKVTCDNSNCS